MKKEVTWHIGCDNSNMLRIPNMQMYIDHMRLNLGDEFVMRSVLRAKENAAKNRARYFLIESVKPGHFLYDIDIFWRNKTKFRHSI